MPRVGNSGTDCIMPVLARSVECKFITPLLITSKNCQSTFLLFWEPDQSFWINALSLTSVNLCGLCMRGNIPIAVGIGKGLPSFRARGAEWKAC